MRRLALLGAASALLALSACSLTGTPSADPDPATTTASASPTPDPVYSPLTGEAVTAERTHPVIVVKMDNTYGSRPQVGLDQADLVVEELVEGGMTRLALFFDSRMPTEVGPVRSLRKTDIALVKPVRATVVASGAAWRTLTLLRKAKVDLWLDPGAGTTTSKNFYRVSNRRAPYNLMFALKKFAKSRPASGAKITSMFEFGDSTAWSTAKPARGLEARFGYSQRTQWRFAKGHYVNTNTNSMPPGFAADTVIVVRVREGDAGYTDPAGNPVPVTLLEGSGPMAMFHNGTMVKGRWFKDGRDEPIYFKVNGKGFPVPVGHTWVELLPTNADGGKLTVQ